MKSKNEPCALVEVCVIISSPRGQGESLCLVKCATQPPRYTLYVAYSRVSFPLFLISLSHFSLSLFQECSNRANSGRFSLRDLLMVPMQRVLKYPLLLQVSRG